MYLISAFQKKSNSYLKFLFILLIILVICSIINILSIRHSNIILIDENNSKILNQKKQIQNASNISYDLSFLQTLIYNNLTNKQITCPTNKYRYISMIIQELNAFHIKQNRTSNIITSSIMNKCKICHKNSIVFIRFKCKNHKLFVNTFNRNNDRKSYFSYYFYSLFARYSQIIPDFDIMIYVGDGFSYYNFDWSLKKYPFFVSEGEQYSYANNGNNHLLLHIISRSLAQKFCKKKPWTQIKNILKLKQNQFKAKANHFVFRANSFWNKYRQTIIDVFHNSSISSLFNGSGSFRTDFEHVRSKEKKYEMNVFTEQRNRYILVVDGQGVRDSFVRQMTYNSVCVKYLSNKYEFWYYDLQNMTNIIYFSNIKELIALCKYLSEIVEDSEDELKMNEIADNGFLFQEQYLNRESVDCFVLHMIQIYNKYLFDEKESIVISRNDLLLDCQTLVKLFPRHINLSCNKSLVEQERNKICLR